MATSHRGHSPADPPDGAAAPLAGYTVAVATDRRRHPLADLLESVGARTTGVQAARSMARADDTALREATVRCLTAPCDEVVVSSDLGLRAWLAAARRWRMADALVARFAGARLLARDAAAADSLRALGLTTIWSTAGAATEELLRYLMAQPVAGRRIVVQTNKLSLPEVCQALRDDGADVIDVPTYTAAPPPVAMTLRRLCDLVIRRQVDALALLGAPVAAFLLAQAQREGRLDALIDALRDGVLCASLGPLAAQPLRRYGIRPLTASRPYLEELADLLVSEVPPRAVTVVSAGHRIELRGHAVVLNGRFVPVQAGPLAVLRVLASHPGRVLSSADIRAAIPDRTGIDDHAVEMAVSRLRQALRGTDLVQTIVRRGYRLAR